MWKARMSNPFQAGTSLPGIRVGAVWRLGLGFLNMYPRPVVFLHPEGTAELNGSPKEHHHFLGPCILTRYTHLLCALAKRKVSTCLEDYSLPTQQQKA